MTEPIDCGCGGKAFVDQDGITEDYKVYCAACGIETSLWSTKEKAILKWNKAMGEGKRERLEYLESMFYTE